MINLDMPFYFLVNRIMLKRILNDTWIIQKLWITSLKKKILNDFEYHKNPKRQKIESSRYGNSFKKEVKEQHMKL